MPDLREELFFWGKSKNKNHPHRCEKHSGAINFRWYCNWKMLVAICTARDNLRAKHYTAVSVSAAVYEVLTRKTMKYHAKSRFWLKKKQFFWIFSIFQKKKKAFGEVCPYSEDVSGWYKTDSRILVLKSKFSLKWFGVFGDWIAQNLHSAPM